MGITRLLKAFVQSCTKAVLWLRYTSTLVRRRKGDDGSFRGITWQLLLYTRYPTSTRTVFTIRLVQQQRGSVEI